LVAYREYHLTKKNTGAASILQNVKNYKRDKRLEQIKLMDYIILKTVPFNLPPCYLLLPMCQICEKIVDPIINIFLKKLILFILIF